MDSLKDIKEAFESLLLSTGWKLFSEKVDALRDSWANDWYNGTIDESEFRGRLSALVGIMTIVKSGAALDIGEGTKEQKETNRQLLRKLEVQELEKSIRTLVTRKKTVNE